jgi:hypothetical protein
VKRDAPCTSILLVVLLVKGHPLHVQYEGEVESVESVHRQLVMVVFFLMYDVENHM